MVDLALYRLRTLVASLFVCCSADARASLRAGEESKSNASAGSQLQRVNLQRENEAVTEFSPGLGETFLIPCQNVANLLYMYPLSHLLHELVPDLILVDKRFLFPINTQAHITSATVNLRTHQADTSDSTHHTLI